MGWIAGCQENSEYLILKISKNARNKVLRLNFILNTSMNFETMNLCFPFKQII